jgi:hypothetical protein
VPSVGGRPVAYFRDAAARPPACYPWSPRSTTSSSGASRGEGSRFANFLSLYIAPTEEGRDTDAASDALHAYLGFFS